MTNLFEALDIVFWNLFVFLVLVFWYLAFFLAARRIDSQIGGCIVLREPLENLNL
jgi:hypothetical protein